MKRRDLAAIMLAICTVRNFGWEAFPDDLKGLASKGLGGLAMCALIWIVFLMSPSRAVRLVALVWSAHELQVFICSFAFMVEPWAVLPGQPMCSARLDFDLGAIGITAIAFLAWHISRGRNGTRH